MASTVADGYLSLYQAHRQRGIGRHRLLAMVVLGELPATVMGGRLFVAEADLDRVADHEAAGSPNKLQAR